MPIFIVAALPVLAAGVVVAAGVILVAAALHDVAFRTVPNWMSLLLAAAGAALHMVQGNLLPALGVGLTVFAAATLCWLRGWLGGGDVKLMAGAALLVPPVLALNLLLDVALAGGVLAAAYLGLGRLITLVAGSGPATTRGALRQAGLLRRVLRAERYRILRRGPLPYASAIAAGTLFVLLKG